MLDPIIILIALACGIASRALGMPALIGYLAAGFLLHEFSVDSGELLERLSDIGITLLLFTIGLKLQPAKLLRTQVWGTAVIQTGLTLLFFALVLMAADGVLAVIDLKLQTLLTIAFALTFSSTVFVIQVMQERGEMASRYANLAIGVLIIQDLMAVGFLAVTTGEVPRPTALLLLILLPLRPLVLRLLTLCGHGELFTLAGLALALGGSALFEAVGIKGAVGAIVLGAWLADHQKAKELSRNLLHFKDLFLVCFFLTIGLSGWPPRELILLSLLLGVLALLKSPLYFRLFTLFHTPPRTALLASLSLANYSEFGLIVIAIAAEEGLVDPAWAAALSLTIAVSFLLNSSFSKNAHQLYRRWRSALMQFESTRLIEARPDTSDARIIILGMGNIGTGAYESIARRFGRQVLGVDENDRKLAVHREHHRRVIAADASDPDFWHQVDLERVELIMLALTNHQENMLVSHLLRDLGYDGQLSAVVRFAEEADDLHTLNISAFNLYAQAGAGFAAHAAEQLRDTPPREN